MRGALLQALAIVVIGGPGATAANAGLPRGIPWVEDWDGLDKEWMCPKDLDHPAF
jgi:hypothetical protein